MRGLLRRLVAREGRNRNGAVFKASNQSRRAVEGTPLNHRVTIFFPPLTYFIFCIGKGTERLKIFHRRLLRSRTLLAPTALAGLWRALPNQGEAI